VGIGPDGDAYGLQVTLAVELPSAGRDEGEKALEAAHQVCPYSRATRGNVQVTLQLV
ncbi:MAG: lipoyl-dependent peroxiredoxin, partial [Frankiaceae bacterium]|nr:lipoyl-dependent peroxiredoxin [Frankiaceae bacterium]